MVHGTDVFPEATAGTSTVPLVLAEDRRTETDGGSGTGEGIKKKKSVDQSNPRRKLRRGKRMQEKNFDRRSRLVAEKNRLFVEW